MTPATEKLVSVTQVGIPLLALASIIACSIGVSFWLNDQFDALGDGMQDLGHRLDGLEGKVNEIAEERAAVAEVRLWIERVRAANPDLTLPDF